MQLRTFVPVVIAAQHSEKVSNETLREGILEEVIFKTIPEELRDKKTTYFVNTSGRFVIGGPKGDCGLEDRIRSIDPGDG